MKSSLAPAAVGPDSGERISLIDALRGSALVGILCIHCVQHFGVTLYPESPAGMLARLDGWTNRVVFFLFSGKSYAIFALLFGLSFALILERWSRRGVNVATRFPWRLFLLGVFGYLHGLLFVGDILLVLALLGMPLVLLHRFSDRALVVLAVLLLAQIPAAWQVGRSLLDPAYAPLAPLRWDTPEPVKQVYAQGSLGAVVAANYGMGQLWRIRFTYESGRYLQMLGLFVCGLLLGRHHMLEELPRAQALGWRALCWGLGALAVLSALKLLLPEWGFAGPRRQVVANYLGGYCSLALIGVWLGAFSLLFLHRAWRLGLNWLAPLGRMSLTCYVTQALVGVPIFFGFGLGLYRDLGPFNSLLCALLLLAVQTMGAHWWLRYFHYGPCEWLWRAGTMRTSQIPFRKTSAA